MGSDLKDLFLAYRRELHAYLTEKLRDAELAAELTQETFLRYAEQGRGGRDGAAIIHERAYLYRTAHNLAVDHVRKQRRQQTDVVPHDDLAHLPDKAPSPEDRNVARETLDRFRAAIAELPERTQRIFVMNRIEGVPYREVARRLEISDSSVQKHLAKALLHVMQRMRQQ